MSDAIEKQIELAAPISRVWGAITDYRQFGEWFGVKLEGPFVEGQVSHGAITYPGYEYVKWEAAVQRMRPERLFSFTWAHPESLDRATYSPDYSHDPKTLVEFQLTSTGDKTTVLRIVESGFEKLPEDRREESYRRNEGGWSEQMKNIEKYLAGET
jgi:uncharacterized protein YndB with AHSA1/START domain